MSRMKDLFKLSLDDSAFQRVFGSFEEKLSRHEQMILELQRLLQGKASMKDLDQLKDDLRKEFDSKLEDLEEKVSKQIDKRIREVENNLKDKIGGLDQLGDLAKRLKSLEDSFTNNNKMLITTHEAVKCLATAYGGLSKTAAPLDNNLMKVLNGSTNQVVNNFKIIFDALTQFKGDLGMLMDKVNNYKEPTAGVTIDLSDINPRPGYVASWRDNPELPQITKFDNINEAVDYIYQLIPKLQGYLNAMHGKIVDNTSDLDGMIDKETLEKLLEKLRQAIIDMDDDLTELRKGMNKSLTRADVIALIKALTNQEDTSTSVGTVRCIACGRETTVVNGAMTEDEALKRLGAPPNSLAYMTIGGGSNYGQLYTGNDTMDREFNESPRSKRPFRASCRVTKQRPKPPS